MTQIFDEFANWNKRLFHDGLVVNGRCVFEAGGYLEQRFLVAPSTVVIGASHPAYANRHPCFEILATLWTEDRLDVLPTEFSNYLSIELTSPLILASPLRLVEFVA